MRHRITTPLDIEKRRGLKYGDIVVLSGYIYTARDIAHKRFVQMIESGQDLPFDIRDQVIFYCGPTPIRDDGSFSAAGPTTSKRMDIYTPKLLELGLAATIGKGERASYVMEAFKKHEAVYLMAIGGAGAYYAKHIKDIDIVAFEDLGCEAVYRLYVEDFVCYVGG